MGFKDNWVDSTMKHGGFMKNDGFQKDFFWIEL
jgi:hypothetical protein